MSQCFQDRGLSLRVNTPKEANHADDTLKLNALEALLESSAAAHFNDVVDTSTIRGKLASSLAPVGIILIVDDVISAKLLKFLGLLCRRSRCDDSCTRSFGEL